MPDAGTSQTEHRMEAPPEAVFAVLGDGWLYAAWVVGATHIRAVDEGWPAVGRRIHHAVGAWPVEIQDVTEVTAVEPPRLLALRARAWPAGEADIRFSVRPDGGGSIVTIAEKPVRGPGRWLYNPLARVVLDARNAETLRRLARLAEGRAR